MKRHPQWPRRLHLLIQSSQAVSFAWGTKDCGQFVGHWIRAATGVDIAAPYRGTYKTEASAEALFLGASKVRIPTALGDFAAQIAAAHSMAEVLPVTCASRGDVVWVDNATREHPSKFGALGVVSLDPRYAVCMSEKGTVRVHMHRWKRAWRVG
jgi:hypothetical protein